MTGISFACVQYESCTAANVISLLFILSVVINMCVASRECTKLGGNADLCFCFETGRASSSRDRVIHWRMVRTVCVVVFLYGCITGSPRGVTHAIAWPYNRRETGEENTERKIRRKLITALENKGNKEVSDK